MPSSCSFSAGKRSEPCIATVQHWWKCRYSYAEGKDAFVGQRSRWAGSSAMQCAIRAAPSLAQWASVKDRHPLNKHHAAIPAAGPDAAQAASAPAAQLDALRSELEAGLSELVQGHLALVDGLAADALSSGAAGQVRSIVSRTAASDPRLGACNNIPNQILGGHILGGHIKESKTAEKW